MTSPLPAQVSPAPITMGNIWDLRADRVRIDRMADTWREHAKAIDVPHNAVDRAAKRLGGDDWSDDAADAYRDHRRRVGRDFDDVEKAVKKVGDVLDHVRGSLRSAQGKLDDSIERVAQAMPATFAGDQVTFAPRTDKDLKIIESARDAAEDIRKDCNDALLDGVRSLFKARSKLPKITKRWGDRAQEYTGDWRPSGEAGDARMIRSGEDYAISTGPGDQVVQITIDPLSGEQIITIRSHEDAPVSRVFTVPRDGRVTVFGGSGSDTIEVTPGWRVGFTLVGGTGEDLLRGGGGQDRIFGGTERDRISGGAGNDWLSGGGGAADAGQAANYINGGAGDDSMIGGWGYDAMYGMDGDDRIAAGAGGDYVDGGLGNDSISGGAGNDAINSGRGSDTTWGGAGNDTTYSVDGADVIDGGTGEDKAYGQDDDRYVDSEHNLTVALSDAGQHISVEGSPEFVARVQSDLDALRASPRGQQLLAGIDSIYDGAHPTVRNLDTLTIRETTEEDVYAVVHSTELPPGNSDRGIFLYEGFIGIAGGPGYPAVDGPPPVLLQHEMAHVYDDGTDGSLTPGKYHGPGPGPHVDDGAPNSERVATGLPFDHDNNPATPEQIDPAFPYDFTENALREEWGFPRRETYSG